ncbi:MAG: NUDIX domain-containing protein [Candidatus Thermoplasmatota archaeon]
MTRRRFCPLCGKANRKVRGTPHRRCPHCGAMDWVNPAPAIGIALVRSGQVLLSRRARAPKRGQWDLVGGFLEAGETPEEGARREVLEETGCKLSHVRFESVLPGDYAGRPTLNFLATGRITGEPKAADDSMELRWWPLDGVPRLAWPHEASFVKRLRKL